MNRFTRAVTIMGVGIGLLFSGAEGAGGTIRQDGDPEVVKAVQASPQFQQVASDNPDLTLAPGMVRTGREGDLAVAVQVFQSKRSGTTLIVSHFIDMATGEVKADKQFRLTVLPDAGSAMASYFPNEVTDSEVTKVARISVSHGGVSDFAGTITDTGLLRGDRGYEAVAQAALAAPGCPECQRIPAERAELSELAGIFGTGGDTVQAPGWCENLMNALCAVSGGAHCFFACAAFGTTPAGLGCAVLCGLIASIGCANTIELVCG